MRAARLWLLVLGAGLGAMGCSYQGPPQVTPAPDATDGPGTPDTPPGDGPTDTAQATARRKQITVDPARVTGGDHPAFPVWISITDDNDLKARATGNGNDLHFTRPDGTALPYQIQRWEKSTGLLQAWVRVDLSDNADTVFELRYGDPSKAHAPDAPMVFSSSFAAVWHLEDALSNTTVAEATNQRTGTAEGGLGTSDQVSAQLGGGVDFDGNDDVIRFTNPYAGGGSHTFSAWVNQRTGAGFDTIVTVGTAALNQSRWFHTRFLDGLSGGFFGNDLPGSVEVIENDGWVLVHWTFNGGSRASRVYVNGASTDSRNLGMGVNTQGASGYLGWAPNQWGPGGAAPCALSATLDEVRLATTDRSPGWIATEYANQRTWPATEPFYLIGAEQPVP